MKWVRSCEGFASNHGDVVPANAFLDVMQANGVMTNLLEGNPVPLGVSKKQAENLRNNLQHIIENHYRTKPDDGEPSFRFPEPGDPNISEWAWRSLLNALTSFETVFREELAETATYYIHAKEYTPHLR